MKACTWQRFSPAALFIKLLKVVFDYIDEFIYNLNFDHSNESYFSELFVLIDVSE